MFNLDVGALAQAGAVGIALGMVMVGGFVAYKVAIRLIGAAETILTNHLHNLTEEIQGMGKTLERIEVALTTRASSVEKKSVSGRPRGR